MNGITLFSWSVIIACGLTLFPAAGRAETAAGRIAVARVNGKILFMDQLKSIARIQQSQTKLLRRGASQTEQEKALQKRAIEQLIDVELLSQQARNHTVPDLTEKVNERLARLRHTRPAIFTETSENGIRERLIDEVLVETYLREKGVAEPDIPEAEIRALYDKGEASFRTEETVRLRHISIQLPADSGPAKKAGARDVLQRARQQILAGTAFESAAQEALRDPGGSQGDLGLLTRREMPEEIATTAFVLDHASISEVIETPSGVHLVSVLERQPARILPYGEVRDFLRKYLREGRRRQVYQTLLQDLRRQAEIEILPGAGLT